ncbi:hypothetical protein [Herpetosiphon sp. NSE202]|uniref:hypothetical protein n=1 Tax=Herpetosiphon sp. NSE202 TaxID=3351349 RepID=UPI00363DF703
MARYRVMGILTDRTALDGLMAELQQAQVKPDDIGVLYASEKTVEAEKDRTDVAAGAAAGVTAGSVVGVVAGLMSFAIPGIGPALGAGILGSTVAGAAAGGVLGAFSQIGLGNDLAASYEQALKDGETILAIDNDNADQAGEVETLLRERNIELVNTFQI